MVSLEEAARCSFPARVGDHHTGVGDVEQVHTVLGEALHQVGFVEVVGQGVSEGQERVGGTLFDRFT